MTAMTMSESDVSEVGPRTNRPHRTNRDLRGIWLQPPPAMALTRAQRRAASRALLPGGTVAPGYRATTAQVARHLRGYRWAPSLFLAVGLLCGASFLVADSPVRWFGAVAAVIGFGFAVVYVNALRKARAIVVDVFGG
jgi:hypothetical protein